MREPREALYRTKKNMRKMKSRENEGAKKKNEVRSRHSCTKHRENEEIREQRKKKQLFHTCKCSNTNEVEKKREKGERRSREHAAVTRIAAAA